MDKQNSDNPKGCLGTIIAAVIYVPILLFSLFYLLSFCFWLIITNHMYPILLLYPLSFSL